MPGNSIMIQGTASNAGKSAIATGLCRWLKRHGISAAPFKPQNMALNSAVTKECGEIGRAQAVQAQACGLEPSLHMNPILLKPNSSTGAQVIVQGKAIGNYNASQYHDLKKTLMPFVLDSFNTLTSKYQVVVVEGAGSPAEINLREGDIANMGFAEAAGVPVVLVADIDRGGVFAQIYGTMALLSNSERARVKGFVINKFRGDKSLLDSGLTWLSENTGKKAFGVVPHLNELYLSGEDSLSLQPRSIADAERKKLSVAVLSTPRLSNRTDFDPLLLQPEVSLKFIEPGSAVPPCDLIILGGSKSVRADLSFIRRQRWDKDLMRHLRYAGKVIAICGGFQMLGRTVQDPYGEEGEPGSSPGLNLFEMETVITQEKRLARVRGKLQLDQASVEGYEIHAGRSSGTALEHPSILLEDGPDGAISDDGLIFGTYVHGLFDHQESLQALLKWAGQADVSPLDFYDLQERNIDILADSIEGDLNMTDLLSECGLSELFSRRI
jgi:adenosylcobyric acid synthase